MNFISDTEIPLNSYARSLSPILESKDYEVMQVNGTRIYGPPPDYTGPIPSSSCELFMQNIPRHLVEDEILPHFERFGLIYEFRLMMDYDNSNRGYAFLKYTCVQDAVKAMDVMNHFIFENGAKLAIRRSYNKCRLYVGKFPKSLSQDILAHTFHKVFPNLHSFILHSRFAEGEENRGFGILEFTNHKDALEAKKMCTPSGLELFGTTLDVSWDKHNRGQEDEEYVENRTLFVRNINPKLGSRELSKLLASRIPHHDVKKISRIRDLAFIDFTNHQSAEAIKKFLNGYQLYEKVISAEWAMPPKEDSIHYLNNCDCDAVLRMKCIANHWEFPTILLGRYFSRSKIQCAALMTKSKITQDVFVYFFEMSTQELSDLQSRMCEIVIHLIKLFGRLPPMHLVISSAGDTAEILGHIPFMQAPQLTLADDIDDQRELYWNEIADLSRMMARLADYNTEELVMVYERKLSMMTAQEYLDPIINGRICGCLNPVYRNRPPLKHDLDNRSIVLILCDLQTGTNYIFDAEANDTQPMKLVIYAKRHSGVRGFSLQLFPRNFVQNNNVCSSFAINKVLFGQNLRMARVDYASSLDSSQFSRLSIGTPSSLTPPESIMSSPNELSSWCQVPIDHGYMLPQHGGGEYGLLQPAPMTPQVSPNCRGQYMDQYHQQTMAVAQNLQLVQQMPANCFQVPIYEPNGCYDLDYNAGSYAMN